MHKGIFHKTTSWYWLEKKHETLNSGMMLFHMYPSLQISLKLENSGQVMKSEFKNDHVLFYLENVSWQ